MTFSRSRFEEGVYLVQLEQYEFIFLFIIIFLSFKEILISSAFIIQSHIPGILSHEKLILTTVIGIITHTFIDIYLYTP